jgi:pyruvate,orthophosphate dikinase
MKHYQVYKIGPPSVGAGRGDTDLLGFKAFNLSRIAKAGLPVPPAFVLGTPHCRRWYQNREDYAKRLPGLLMAQLEWLQAVTGLGFGDPRRPLLVSVRSGAPVSMPGMMDTLLNIGLCDNTVHGLLRLTGNPRLVWDSYRRLVQSFAEVVYGVSPQPFSAGLDAILDREQVGHFQELGFPSLAELTHGYLELFAELTGQPFPQDPFDQLKAAVEAVFASWNSPRALEFRAIYRFPDNLCTAVTVQKMVFGNSGGMSGAGVGFTRNPDTGDNGLYVDFLFNSQGEDIVSGRNTCSDANRLYTVLPQSRQELLGVCAVLEKEFRDAQEFEFTIQDGSLFLLQSRTARRTPWAALRIAVDQVNEGIIDKGEALARLNGLAVEKIKRQRISAGDRQPFCKGKPAGMGVTTGPVALDVGGVRRFAAAGIDPPILVSDEISTADIGAMALSGGILTVRGSRTSHAAVIARQLGKPCITGCNGIRIDYMRRVIESENQSIAEGELITLDSNTGRVFSGKVDMVTDYPTPWLNEIRKWRLLAID